jgi:hypothetical protein
MLKVLSSWTEHRVTCHLLSRWRWRRYVPPKSRLTFYELHGIMSQKMVLFITTFVRTSSDVLVHHHSSSLQYMEVNGQLHAPAALTLRKRPEYTFDRRLGGHQSRSGRCGVQNSFCPYREANPGCQARKSYPCNGPWSPIGLWDVEAPTFFRQSAHRWRWDCQPEAPATLYPQEDSWYSFLLEAE